MYSNPFEWPEESETCRQSSLVLLRRHNFPACESVVSQLHGNQEERGNDKKMKYTYVFLSSSAIKKAYQDRVMVGSTQYQELHVQRKVCRSKIWRRVLKSSSRSTLCSHVVSVDLGCFVRARDLEQWHHPDPTDSEMLHWAHYSTSLQYSSGGIRLRKNLFR